MTTFPNSSASPQSGEAATPDGCVVLEGGFIPWDNPDNLVSQTTDRVVDTAVGAVCLPLLFVLSVPCNLLNMLVFCRQGLAERINLCLFSLSLVDFVHMLNSFIFNVKRLQSAVTGFADYGPVVLFLFNNGLSGLRSVFPSVSGFISMLIACERCLCVLSPLRAHTMLKTRTMTLLILVAVAVITTGCLLGGQRWSVVCVFDPLSRTTFQAAYTSQLYTRYRSLMDTLGVFVLTLQPLTYVIVVSAMTAMTSLKLKKMASWRERMSTCAMSTREMALTRTLIAGSVLYVVCSVPSILCGIFGKFMLGLTLRVLRHNLIKVLASFFKLASFFNATFNFFVYVFLGSKFNDTLHALFRCKDAKDK